MKKSVSVTLAAALIVTAAVSVASAQNITQPPASTLEKPAAVPDSHGSGTDSKNLGATGWTGGTRGETETTGKNAGAPPSKSDGEAAKDQPLTATGEDLKGPPKQFPAAKTPE